MIVIRPDCGKTAMVVAPFFDIEVFGPAAAAPDAVAKL